MKSSDLYICKYIHIFADVEKGPKVKKAKLLPPCRICGEKASGLHYGVNTCEACKVKILLVWVQT